LLALARQRDIGRLKSTVLGQVVPKSDDELPVCSRIVVFNGADFRSDDRPPWIGQQCIAQFPLGNTSIRRHGELGARQIDFDELVGRYEPALLVAIKQVMA
jgi:hypothetical protein